MKTSLLRQALSVSAVLATLCTALPTCRPGCRDACLRHQALWPDRRPMERTGRREERPGLPGRRRGGRLPRRRLGRAQAAFRPWADGVVARRRSQAGGVGVVDRRIRLRRLAHHPAARLPPLPRPLDQRGRLRRHGPGGRRGDSGRMRVRVATSSGYRFYVQGCDVGISGSGCKHGWTVSVTAR